MKHRIAQLLRRTAQRLDPQPPPLTPEQILAKLISDQMGKGIVGRGFTPGKGIDWRY